MSLKITLKPNELIIVNGCVIKNSNRRHTMMIQNFADIIRGSDILSEEDADTPLKKVYFLIQTAFIETKTREKLIPYIQQQLAELFNIFSSDIKDNIMKCANYVSVNDFYKALTELKPAIEYEKKLLEISG
jgi:flagellar protein FlbT